MEELKQVYGQNDKGHYSMHDKFPHSSRTSEPGQGSSANVTTRLRDVQLERHRITFDATLIKNRVNQLRSIEAKMLKKIDKTRM